MPVLDSYLFFDGNCAEAMRFYERTLGGKLDAILKYSDAPEPNQCPPGADDRVMHARLVLDGRSLMASDTPPGMGGQGLHGFSLSLGYKDAAEARRVFDALSQGGSVQMPMQKTFWAESFGMLTDRFGVAWMVSAAMHAV